jgi:hypothetical protein
LGEADEAGGDFKRTAEDELPDEQEGHQPSEPRAAKGFAQIDEGAARSGHGGGEFGPDETVADRQERAEQPAEHALGTAHRRDDERDREERSDAYHVAHVERGGLEEVKTSYQVQVRRAYHSGNAAP